MIALDIDMHQHKVNVMYTACQCPGIYVKWNIWAKVRNNLGSYSLCCETLSKALRAFNLTGPESPRHPPTSLPKLVFTRMYHSMKTQIWIAPHSYYAMLLSSIELSWKNVCFEFYNSINSYCGVIICNGPIRFRSYRSL